MSARAGAGAGTDGTVGTALGDDVGPWLQANAAASTGTQRPIDFMVLSLRRGTRLWRDPCKHLASVCFLPQPDISDVASDDWPHPTPKHAAVTLLRRDAKRGSEGEEAMNWREHLRILATLVNGFFAMFLIGNRGWWMSMGLGVPMIVPPVLAIIALSVNHIRQRDTE